MDYLKIAEVAQMWGISPRRLQILCAEGKIPGATRFGRAWMIPVDAQKPIDGRTKASREAPSLQAVDMPMPRKTPFLYMTDLYTTPGTADAVTESLADNPEAQTLFALEIAHLRGDIDSVYQKADYLLPRHSGLYAVLSAGILLARCAIWRGDLQMWRRAKIHIAEAPTENEMQRDIVSFAILSVDSMLYDVTSFPEWFKIGCFEPLPGDAMTAAGVFYAKYLYAAAFAVATKELAVQGTQGLYLMSAVPFTVEPMISRAYADRIIGAEICLRLTCATLYHNCGNDEQAIRHIDRAIALALPDKLYGLLAEYCRPLDTMLQQRLSIVAPDACEQVEQLYKGYYIGWSKLSSSVRSRTIATTLSPRQREVAKLAAFGMKNEEIAKALHISVSSVKQAITGISTKTGMSRSEFAAIL